MKWQVGVSTVVFLCVGCQQPRCPPGVLIDPRGPEAIRPRRALRVATDLPYRGRGSYYNTLDLYLPANADAPVVFYVHGCGWTRGDKTMDAHLGRWFASNGIAAAVVNYRLPPDGRFAEQIGDVAKAFAWTYRNIASYGVARPERMIVCGWSAGGHLAALLATDPRYLRAEGISPDRIEATILVSGVLKLNSNVELAGLGYLFRGFALAEISPIERIRPGLPPFLLMYCQHDLPTLGKHARQFHERLIENGCSSHLFEIPREWHYTEMNDLVLPGAVSGRRVMAFIREVHGAPSLSAGNPAHSPGSLSALKRRA